MSSKSKVPDAWDDDWVNQADQSSSSPPAPLESEGKVSKKERRARQAELNKKLWEEAETPATPYFVESRNEVPLRSELKPAVKVLSRKPTPTVIARKDPVSGIEKLVIEDEGDDEEHEENKAKASTAEERQLKAQKEREEKLKKYDQVRERLFGTPTPSASVEKIEPSTPPRIKSPGERGRGRGKGSGLMETRAGNSALGKAGKQLYDPNHVPKPDSAYLQKKEAQESGRSTPVENQIIRKPRGPDQSGRGGFGFTNRGNRKAPQGVELSGQ